MKGYCLCQKVVIEAPNCQEIHACHCNYCRKWGGSAGFTFLSQGITVNDNANTTHYQSSDWGERAFCKTCGTHLYFHQLDTDNYYVSAGLFDDVEFRLGLQIFIDKKACYYELANDTPKLTKAQFLAMVGA